MRRSLADSYRLARYRVSLDQGTVELRIGRRHPALRALVARHQAPGGALITAHNPRSRLLSPAVNQRAQAALEDRARRAGYTLLASEGRDPDGAWPPEAGVLVVGIDRADAVELASAFGQNALVWVDADGLATLVWTDRAAD